MSIDFQTRIKNDSFFIFKKMLLYFTHQKVIIMKGYKCFNKDFTNTYGDKFTINHVYSTSDKLSLEVGGNGFHYCKNLEDTLRYFDAMNEEVIICEVIGSGEILTTCDEYNGYYDIYIAERIEIIKVLTREEIIEMMLNANFFRANRFIQCFKLTETEIEKFKEVFSNKITVLKTIDYYQNSEYIKRLKKINYL